MHSLGNLSQTISKYFPAVSIDQVGQAIIARSSTDVCRPDRILHFILSGQLLHHLIILGSEYTLNFLKQCILSISIQVCRVKKEITYSLLKIMSTCRMSFK